MKEALVAQDGLYTLVVKHPDGTYEPRIIGSIVEYLFAPDDPESHRGHGSALDPNRLPHRDGGRVQHPPRHGRVRQREPANADLQPGATPRTTFGFVTEALRRRRNRGVAPFTVMSADNLQGNGHLAHRVFSAFARRRDAELADWIDHEVQFPNSMVDRITPVTTEADRELVRERFGVDESGRSSVSPLPNGCSRNRSATDVRRTRMPSPGRRRRRTLRLMKLRLLNAGHQALCYFGYLCGYRLVHDAQDPLFRTFLLQYMDKEATPTLSPVPGVDLDEYKHTLIERFSNPGGPRHDRAALRGTRTASRSGSCRSSANNSVRVANQQVRRGRGQLGPVRRGNRRTGPADSVVDPLKRSSRRSQWLVIVRIPTHSSPIVKFGDLVDDKQFVVAYRSALTSLHERGRATLQSLI